VPNSTIRCTRIDTFSVTYAVYTTLRNAECICDVRNIQVHAGYKLYPILSSPID